MSAEQMGECLSIVRRALTRQYITSVQNASQYAAGSHAITYRMLVLPFNSWFRSIYIDQVRASWK